MLIDDSFKYKDGTFFKITLIPLFRGKKDLLCIHAKYPKQYSCGIQKPKLSAGISIPRIRVVSESDAFLYFLEDS